MKNEKDVMVMVMVMAELEIESADDELVCMVLNIASIATNRVSPQMGHVCRQPALSRI
jgi:hypothetical protein